MFDIAYGILVMTGVCAPAVHFEGTLFTDAAVPMLLVAIVVGGSSLLAAATVYIRHAWSVFLAAAAGLIMIAWEVTEIAVVLPIPPAIRILCPLMWLHDEPHALKEVDQ